MTPKEKADYKRAWYLKNKVKCQAKHRAWYLANREQLLEKEAERYVNKREYIKERVKRYSKSHGAIKKKLTRHQEEDRKQGRDFDLTYDYVINLLKGQDNECAHCDTKVKLAWTTAYDPAQFSINRIKNKYGHIIGNVEITCLQCNRTYKERFRKISKV